MSRLEKEEQKDLAKWLNKANVLWKHTPNEGKRRNGRELIAMGMRSGVPDVEIFTDPPGSAFCEACGWNAYVGAAIELKRTDGTMSDVSENQKKWLKGLAAESWATYVAFGAEDAIRWLKSLGYRSALDDH